MNLLSRLRLRTKLTLLMGLAAVGLIASIGVAASVLHQRMLDDRVDKLHAVTDVALGLARSLEAQVADHRLSQQQALEQFRVVAHTIRFDAGEGYIVAQTDKGFVVIHGANPQLDNKASTAKDATGRPLIDDILAALHDSDHGVVSYEFVRPGRKVAEPKVAYLVRFTPWHLILIAGAYTGDLNAAFATTLRHLALLAGSILLLSLLAAWLINRDITVSLGRLGSAMARLSHGELDVTVPGGDRRDEVGAMAAAVTVFQQGMQRAERLAREQQEERELAETRKRDALVAMAETIEEEARCALAEAGLHTDAMEKRAQDMSGSAQRTGGAAEAAAAAANQALSNAQTVASAAEQLTASIREIGSQVSQSNQVVARAVEAGRSTRDSIQALNEQVGRIGRVADMIGEIAAKTNLLALNATIEAARAGDAGKGFAVVASEVKQLATQTARSTEQISRHISEVHAATNASVAAVAQIETTIGEVNAIAGSIAAAVEQQGAATAEIARNVSETATAANQMTQRIGEVSEEASRTDQQATEVLADTHLLRTAMSGLQRTVVQVVRTASGEVDRRRFRRRPCLLPATVAADGRSEEASIHDLSELGCLLLTAMRFRPGQRIEITMSRGARRLPGMVVAQDADTVHVAFTGEELTAAEADSISLATIGDLIEWARSDHRAFVRRVAEAVRSGQHIPSDQVPDQHNCRFGRWRDTISDAATLALPSFANLVEPHRGVHECGRHALLAAMKGDMPTAHKMVAEMEQHSARILQCLEEFARAYPETIQPQATAPAAVAA